MHLHTTVLLLVIFCVNAYADHGNEHSDSPGYNLVVSRRGGGAIVANQEVILDLVPTHLDDFINTTSLSIIHDRFIHVVLLAHDYSHFVHTHPEDWTNDIHDSNSEEKYTINATFPLGGEWIVGIDFLHSVDGKERVINVFSTITVDGPAQGTPAITDFSTTGSFKKYEFDGVDRYAEHVEFATNTDPNGYVVNVKFNNGENFHANSCIPINFEFFKPGGQDPLGNIIPYLDAPMHAIFVHEDREKSYFYHLHATQTESGHGHGDGHDMTHMHSKRHSDGGHDTTLNCAHNHNIGGFNDTEHLGHKMQILFNFPHAGKWFIIVQAKLDDIPQHDTLLVPNFAVEVEAAHDPTDAPTATDPGNNTSGSVVLSLSVALIVLMLSLF